MADATMTAGCLRRRATLEDPDDVGGATAAAVARAQAGDTEAIAFLYRRYAGNVCGYVYSIVGDEQDAEDLTQQLFAKLMTALSRYEARSQPFSRWLLRVARNLAIDHVRSRRPLPAGELEATEVACDDQARCESRRSLMDALGSLPTDQRDVVTLRYLGGLSPGEIAVELQRTRGSVIGLHHRGRRALCRALTQLEAAPAVRRDRPMARDVQGSPA